MLNSPNLQMDDDEINLMDILLIIAKYNRFIIFFTVISAVLAFVYALKQPVLYTANVLIMPPQAPISQAGMVMGQLSSLGLGPSMAGAAAGAGASIAILMKSQKLGYQVVKRLKLQSLYKAKNIEDARTTLMNATDVVNNKDGTIRIECSDKDPRMAALLANTYVEELDLFNNTIAVTNASRMRLYLEKQLNLAKKELANAELAVKESQKNTNLSPLEVQSGGMIGLIGSLRGQITSRELELANLRAYATEQNPDYKKAMSSLAELKSHLDKLEHEDVNSQNSFDFNNRSLKTGSFFLNNMRDLTYQREVVANLKQQYDIAKMDEAKQANLIQVINSALLPEMPSKPKRDVIVTIGALLGLILSIILAFIMNGLDMGKQNPESAERLKLLRRYLQQGK